ncbi:tRNA-dihydrouridine synthase family protein [Candidatus Haliotispira prima]|uniref:tRNA-dihydrouridine synthase family protein n=1 Tax=Candidatus Haliotispira prima TaxID=3034016 RepID=A0ABY8MIH3_9SPIO|nr:tRNA-dihydrouridine synthase family protein [Candidatus Haliotispira prima]
MPTFWQKLAAERGFLRVQAPMEGVTDIAFRAWLSRYAPPDIYFTEFSSFSGLLQGRADTMRRLSNDQAGEQGVQRPLVAQLWGNDAEQLGVALPRLVELGFDGVDLNFGCPHRKIVAKPAGGGLLQEGEQSRALAMLQCCLSARAAGEIPPSFGISVKTRPGFARPDWGFLFRLLDCRAGGRGLDALTVHFRLASVPKSHSQGQGKSKGHINHKDNSLWAKFATALPQPWQDGPCYWNQSEKLLKLRRQSSGSGTLLLGSGGLGPGLSSTSWAAAQATGLDGWMAARALFDDPLYLGRSDCSGRQRDGGKYCEDWTNCWQRTRLPRRLFLLQQHLLLYRRYFYHEGQGQGPIGKHAGFYEVFKKFYRVYLPQVTFWAGGRATEEDKEGTRLLSTLQVSRSVEEALEILNKRSGSS